MVSKRIIHDGYSCKAGTYDKGWYAAINIIEDHDRDFSEDCYESGFDRKVKLYREITLSDWEEATVPPARKIIYLQGTDGNISENLLTYATRVSGPEVGRGRNPVPLVVWTEKKNNKWSLKVKKGEKIKLIYETEKMLCSPAVAYFKDSYISAAEANDNNRTQIFIFSENGDKFLEIEGRKPILISSEESLFLLYEKHEGEESEIKLNLVEVRDGSVIHEWTLKGDDLNFNGDLAYDQNRKTLYIVWESTPAWGNGPFVGRHRDIRLWKLEAGATPQPAAGTCNGKLDIPREAYIDGSYANISPVNSSVLIINNEPAVTFRRFRYRGHRCFGWDVYITKREGNSWTECERISKNIGPSDANYSVINNQGELLGFFPSCDNKPNSTRIFNHRVEIQAISDDLDLSWISAPIREKGFYQVPFSVKGAAPEPPVLENTAGFRLIWGDIHIHSHTSKCMCAINGSPEDVLRYTRDLLGCRVLTLTDHTDQMGASEFTWTLDRLEEAAGENCIVLYSCEPSVSPGHHTNFYAIDRKTFERLRLIVITHQDRKAMYGKIKELLPSGSILALRHFHGERGEYGIDSQKTTTTWDPELEVAMEAMQIRGDIMMGRYEEGKPLFPSNFLNVGAKIGLVGGSDHTSGNLLNHFCLTGFWVRKLTPKAVWEALRQRRTLACSNGKISIWAELNGYPMGSEVRLSGDVDISVSVSSARTVRRICLIRDGKPLRWVNKDSKKFKITLRDEKPLQGSHWYSVTAEGISAFQEGPCYGRKREGVAVLAHTSPFFVNVME